MVTKFGPIKKRIKKTDVIQDEISQNNSRYTPFEHKRKEGILEKMKVEPLDEKLRRYKSSSVRHVTRMNKNMVTKITLNYRPHGKRRF
jgi:hypothetical protein